MNVFLYLGIVTVSLRCVEEKMTKNVAAEGIAGTSVSRAHVKSVARNHRLKLGEIRCHGYY